ncbi:MAG: hypothetical protein U0893_09700 [Chloroflexota bacterium]
MIPAEYKQLLAERSTLQRLLADIPEEEVLTRGSFVARLDDVEDRLAALGADTPEPARAQLTFRGRPVVGSHGVFADFGLKATGELVEAVNRIAAALNAPLAPTGPIPNRGQNRLLVTGTVVGSFGFTLEEYVEPAGSQLALEPGLESSVSKALAQTQDLLAGTLGTDDELADAIAEVDPRARGAVRDFLETLAANDATFTLQRGQRVVAFREIGEIQQSVRRLGPDNVREEQEVFAGMLQGILPELRTFEFKVERDGRIIRGKLGPAIVNPDELNQHHLYQSVQIRVLAVRVGTRSPRYVLNELPDWQE